MMQGRKKGTPLLDGRRNFGTPGMVKLEGKDQEKKNTGLQEQGTI